MSEQHPKYATKNEAKLRESTLKRFDEDGYEHPTGDDVRALKAVSGLTGRELCTIAGVADQRSWRRWSQDAADAGARQIPYSAWRLLLLELGIVKPAGSG